MRHRQGLGWAFQARSRRIRPTRAADPRPDGGGILAGCRCTILRHRGPAVGNRIISSTGACARPPDEHRTPGPDSDGALAPNRSPARAHWGPLASRRIVARPITVRTARAHPAPYEHFAAGPESKLTDSRLRGARG